MAEYIKVENGQLVLGADWDAEIEQGYQKLEEAQRQTEAEQARADEAWQRYCEGLASAACDAEELFELDDLEAYAEAWRAKHAIA